MMKEIISPNVKYIGGLEIPVLPRDIRATVHENGIIVIDTHNPDCLDAVKACFKDYEAENAVYPVSTTGLPTSVLSNHQGSERFCAWDGAFAESLTEIIKIVEAPELISDNDSLWEFISVSKYFRFMHYKHGGEHFPHYDSDFNVIKHPGSMGARNYYSTRYSLVMYFNDCDSGELAFINNPGTSTDDWDRQAYDSEIYLKVLPKAGRIVLFPHTLCHSVLTFAGDERYVVRGDLIFTKVQ